MPPRATLTCTLLLLTLPGGAWAQDRPPPAADPAVEGAHRTGTYTATFTERSPLTDRARIQARLFRAPLTEQHPDYSLADEAFHIAVPKDYDADTPHGLVLWISPGHSGAPPKEWLKELADRDLIWIGANNAGNDREIWQRLSLPLDALHNMSGLYNLDPDRIYVCGVSGGGRSSSRLAVGMPDVISGAMPIVGVDFYERVEAPDHPGQFYRAFKKPTRKLLAYAQQHLRLVIVTGQTDYNRDQCKLFAQLYSARGFQHVQYIEVEGMGHVYPEAEWFGKGLDALDAPLLAARAAEQADAAPAQDDRPAAATKSQAREKLDLARNYIAAGKDDAAKAELREVVEQYPGTREARIATGMLRALEDE